MRVRRSEARRLLTNAPFVLGSLGLAAIAAMAFFGPQLAPTDPQAQRVVIFYPDHSFAAPPTPPDQYYLLGTDPLGRDQLSRLLWGARLTVTVLLLGLLGRGALGILLGVLAGWRRDGWLDRAIAHVTNAVGGLPQLLLALLIVIALRDAGITGFVLALALVGWAELAQFVRAEVVRAVSEPHIEAARGIGGTAVHVARAHVLRDIGPQLVGLLALEAGSVLLLLAELGFIGFFISGGTFYVDDNNRPILPIRDRAPEWGQMLAGARQYAFRDQYVAFVPGVVVVGAVVAFNLFAEGLRTATDPFSVHRLLPRTLGRIGRIAAAAVLIGAVGLGYVSLRSTAVSFDDGAALARESARRVLPGSELVAGVVRFASESHALARPEKLNYYFRSADGTILRVGLVDADANALEVKLHSHEDDLLLDGAQSVSEWRIGWEEALSAAERVEGIAFRNANPRYLVRVVLAQDAGAHGPSYRVRYAKPAGGTILDIRTDARTGTLLPAPGEQLTDARSRAREALAGDVELIGLGATWNGPASTFTFASGARGGFGIDRPVAVAYTFRRRDLPGDARSALVSYIGGKEASPTLSVGTVPATGPTVTEVDLVAMLGGVEAAGGRGVRETWERGGITNWFISADTRVIDGRGYVEFRYIGSPFATFRVDPRTGTVERLGR